MSVTTDEKLEWIAEQIGEGRTVSLATAYRVTHFSHRDIERFTVPLVKKGKDGCLLMLEGYTKGQPRYVDASYCKLTAL